MRYVLVSGGDVERVPEPGDDIDVADDPVARAEFERRAGYVPNGPPWDVGERLRAALRDVDYIAAEAASQRRIAQVQMARAEAYLNALRKIVMAADRGGSLTRHLEAAREILPKSRYRRPPR